ncbi:UDP-N-acetylglucosamine 2-epimerase [Nitrosarchaeum sp. AC2]|uniref:UDP-N-acetylglucosamine 2-epimerase n=1 Tax=Nitrosarchaeum sp. AC2 TaxID=2259673 RepID=UPI0015CAA707|nr:UDP-N-acetylglucosamine 2-epimerase [Nitrosarchaeum sp. AC2]QLH10220.1 hypothetical protein DSQ20_00880 [Nitrosarchaeum sp. AC2]
MTLSKSEIILVDSTISIDDVNYNLNHEIIALDYLSHIQLSNKKIDHKISDDFVTIEELQKLESQIHHFVNWHALPEFSTIILEDGINLGELFYIEFYDILTSFLKKFLEISSFLTIYPNNTFLVSEYVYEIISRYTKNVKVIKTKTKNESIYSYIEIPVKIGPKIFTLKLNSEHASMIQTILDKCIKIFLLNKKIKTDDKSILLVNFTTLKNENFLLTSSKFHLNLIKYDRGIPSIWNKKTFNIIKNSNCIMENESNLLNKETMTRIKLNQQIFETKLDSILSYENVLAKHFSINTTSFWNALKPFFIQLYKRGFFEAAKEIELAKQLFQKYYFSKVLILNEAETIEQIILHFAKKQQIPVFQLQHGLYYDSPQMISKNTFQRLIPKNSDFFISYGDSFKNYLIHNGIKSNRVKSMGSIFFDNIFDNKISEFFSSDYVLLAADPYAFNRSLDLTINQQNQYHNTIAKICQVISNQKKHLIIKTHPQKHAMEDVIAKQIDPKIQVFHSGDIQPLIKSSSLVIVTDMSTVILEAQAMKKPVISIPIKDHFGKPEVFNFCPQIKSNELESWIKSFYKNPDVKNNLIEKGNQFLKLYLANPGSASSTILSFLENDV